MAYGRPSSGVLLAPRLVGPWYLVRVWPYLHSHAVVEWLMNLYSWQRSRSLDRPSGWSVEPWVDRCRTVSFTSATVHATAMLGSGHLVRLWGGDDARPPSRGDRPKVCTRSDRSFTANWNARTCTWWLYTSWHRSTSTNLFAEYPVRDDFTCGIEINPLCPAGYDTGASLIAAHASLAYSCHSAQRVSTLSHVIRQDGLNGTVDIWTVSLSAWCYQSDGEACPGCNCGNSIISDVEVAPTKTVVELKRPPVI